MTKNRIHHILDRNHVVMLPCSNIFGKSGRQLLDQTNISTPDNLLLKAHLELMDHIQTQDGDAEKWIKKTLREHPGIATLRTIPGLRWTPLVRQDRGNIKVGSRYPHSVRR